MNERRTASLKRLIRLWIDPRVRPTKRTRRIYYMGFLSGYADGWYGKEENDERIRATTG